MRGLSSMAIMVIIAFTTQTMLSSIRACVQFARGAETDTGELCRHANSPWPRAAAMGAVYGAPAGSGGQRG